MTDINKTLTYQKAGVDITKANTLVQTIKHLAKKTQRTEVLGGVGGFAGLFELGRYHHPVLVPSTDGVGTKLKIALATNRFDTIGIDLVAMCVNDVITVGAEPLFFLDYYATGALDPIQAESVIKGIVLGCEEAQMTLIGGETAELPGLYHGSDFDLAGFCVGVVEKEAILSKERVKIGDALIALPSSGPHANGFSLIRAVLEHTRTPLDNVIHAQTLTDILLTPTFIYAKAIRALKEKIELHAIAHITGGGLIENLPRVLPAHSCAVLNTSSWQWPPLFSWLMAQGHIPTNEMWRTFNLGVGLVICLPQNEAAKALTLLKHQNFKAWQIGQVNASSQKEPYVELC